MIVHSAIYVVEERENPSTNYFVLPAVRAIGKPVHWFRFDELPSAPVDALVIFVRYVPEAWRKWVEDNGSDLTSVVLFMDDDVLDWKAAAGMPWHYRWKLWRLSGSQRDWLRGQGAALWVSTPYLQEKYADWPVSLVLPSAPDAEPDGVTRIFYHGSASHRTEIDWLAEIMQPVMAAEPLVRFELVGDRAVHRAWRRFPGVTVIHPMNWPAYRAFCGLQGRHVGLAPLLKGNFNCARSYTKFFDITRCGAVGVYSRHPAFMGAVRDGLDGCLVDNQAGVWAETVLMLVRDGELRARMHASALGRMAALSSEAQAGYGELLNG